MPLRPARVVGCLIVALIAGLLAPPARAQTAGAYFPATGHTLTDDYGFLGFWQARDGLRLLGAPVSEPLQLDGGVVVQYFERARLERVPDPATEGAAVRTGAVAAEYAAALGRTFPPMPPRRASAGLLVFEETGHSLRAPFLGFWEAAGGAELLGRPISEPHWEQTPRGQRRVQYFERARLERDADMAGTPDEIRVADLGLALALLRGVDTAPVANPGFDAAGPPVPLSPDVAAIGAPPASAPVPFPAARPAPNARPAPTPAPPAPAAAPAPAAPVAPVAAASSGKRILVNLSDQWLYAYQDGELVFDAPVATGRDGMETPPGTFSIYAKIPLQTMDGITDGVPWVVPNVPNVMYIHGGVALHGTYWHNLFGSGARPSHGCVNLPLKAAKWLYGWAPVGTQVKVTY